MKKQISRFFIIIAVLLLVFAAFLFYRQQKKLPENPAAYSGNTAANLYNKGLFAEHDGVIYFANGYDNDYLYRMDADLTNVKRLYEDSVEYINVDSAGKYLYYSRINYRKKNSSAQLFEFSSSGIYRLRTNGKNLTRLYGDLCGSLLLAGNELCYQTYGEDGDFDYHIMKSDGTDASLLTAECITPLSYYQGSLFFTGTGMDHSIYETPVSVYAPSLVAEVNGYMPVAAADGIYYISQSDGYLLKRLSYTDGTSTVLVPERISTFNLSNDGSLVFYQADGGTNNRLCCYDRTTGTTKTLLDGNYKNLNVTSRYLFFESFDDSAMYYYNLADQTVHGFRPPVEKSDKK